MQQLTGVLMTLQKSRPCAVLHDTEGGGTMQLASDVINQVKRQRNAWRLAAIVSLILNVIQFIRSK